MFFYQNNYFKTAAFIQRKNLLLNKLTFRCIVLLACIMYFSIDSLAAIGQSAVITLVLPHGARQSGMGDVGTALADDEHALFWNPAGLGIKNEELQGGAFGILHSIFRIYGIPRPHIANR